MTSSVDTRRQPIDGDGEPSISAERSDLPSIPGSFVRLQSNQRNETPVLSDAQRQSTNEIEVKSKEEEGKEEEFQQQEAKEREDEEQRVQRESEEEKQREREALQQVMEDLKDATDFGSYYAYLESLHRDPMYAGRSYEEILEGCFHSPNKYGPGVDIIDVLNEDLSPVGVSPRCSNLSASEIPGALCHPPANTRAQIVLWPVDTYTGDIKDFLDVLGVGLQLDPCFFEALRWREDETRYTHHFQSKNSLCVRSIGTSVFVARSFVLAQDSPVPVVLIAGPMRRPFDEFNRRPISSHFTRQHPNKAIYDLVQAAPLYHDYNCDGAPHGVPLFANAYIRALFSLLNSGRDSVLSSSDILSACMNPLLQIEIAICKGDLDHLRNLFREFKDVSFEEFGFRTKYRVSFEENRDRELPDGETPEYLYCYRTKLRSWIEYFGNENGALMGLLSSLLGANVTKGLFCSQIKEESISIVEEASRLEAEIRDYLQLQGSRLALLESKKSIELSNNQIYEGKRVKIFTVLAFFYIPLNLATSGFGMNIQQLNRSGASIGVFLATAVLLLFVTGLSWLFLKGVQDAQVWLRRALEDRVSIASRDPSILVRLYLIWWLSRNGLFKWMIYTGAGLCLLINSSSGFRSQSGFSNGSIEYLRAIEVIVYIMPEVEHWRVHLPRGGWLPQLLKR
ncbi:hypothetical protein JMJ35_000527 [Cladonia borealis]|uniref:Uncharacterized protein n=1 Tax=Cladonia borealis TaxID=184061 RepID=A0AA39R9E1_9LECA|nr:hypothetical protein JMJ35_000527 [Cladonia borealis]